MGSCEVDLDRLDELLSSVPSLDDISKRRKIAEGKRQIILAQQARAMQAYKLHGRRLALLDDAELLYQEIEESIEHAEKLKQRYIESQK